MLVEPESRICFSLDAATANGTSCNAEARFWAVTTTSSITSGSLDGVAAVATPDIAASTAAEMCDRNNSFLQGCIARCSFLWFRSSQLRGRRGGGCARCVRIICGGKQLRDQTKVEEPQLLRQNPRSLSDA